jgi:6-phosphogluconolactonase/glucosamine-6-phosphate isomerase/deaminase
LGFVFFSVCWNEAVAVAVINSSECNRTCNKVVVSGGGMIIEFLEQRMETNVPADTSFHTLLIVFCDSEEIFDDKNTSADELF